MSIISFGDTVRIKATSLTRSQGFAGLLGEVVGHTVPSSSGVTGVISDKPIDYAIGVFIEARKETNFFDEELLEFVTHVTVKEIRINGSLLKLVRDESGEWKEQPD